MRYLLATIGLAMLLVTSAISVRPLLPVDETRYLTVAWEAHVTGDYLVSHLNTETYAHKPPLLFWLINAVWSVTGVNEYAARLVAPLAGIACLLLTAIMARRLWPESTTLHRCAPMVLASITLWMILCPLTMFDTLLTSCTLLALLGILRAEAGDVKSGWLLAGIAMGLGILAKGPVVLVHVMPAALFAPWWSVRIRNSSGGWYAGCIAALAIAAAIGLSWALPSAAAGGRAYSDELLYGQTAGRMVNSFAHRHPFWWYLPFLPFCLQPWISLGAAWRGLWMTRLDPPMKFLLCWAGSSLLILSLVSGKQIHYLLPAIPAVSLILTRLMTAIPGAIPKRDLTIIIAGTIVLALVPLVVNHLTSPSPAMIQNQISDWYVVPLMACGVMLIPFPFKRIESTVFAVGTASILFVMVVIVSARTTMWRSFDLGPLAQTAASHNDIAWYGLYDGQLNYLGGIPYVHETHGVDELSQWLTEHPDGIVIEELSAPNVDAMAIAGIDVPGSDTASNTASSSQLEQITQIVRADSKFPGHEWQPTISHLFWIRPRFSPRPFVVVHFEDPPHVSM
jgi:4-amino-4-deoxy-L-arabinose transferase-like glycosyltransferase